MYPLPELVAQAAPFGGADLAQQRGTVAELAQICQTWGRDPCRLAHHRNAWPVRTTRGTAVGDQPGAPASLDEARLDGPRLDGPRLDEPKLDEPKLDEHRLDKERATELGICGRATGL